MSPERYNGFANYETWAVNLWLTNDHPAYSEFRELAENYSSEESYEFGQEIKKRVEQGTEDILEQLTGSAFAGMISDIFHANLTLVDWDEIAQGFQED